MFRLTVIPLCHLVTDCDNKSWLLLQVIILEVMVSGHFYTLIFIVCSYLSNLWSRWITGQKRVGGDKSWTTDTSPSQDTPELMFSPCLFGFLLSSPFSFHLPKTWLYAKLPASVIAHMCAWFPWCTVIPFRVYSELGVFLGSSLNYLQSWPG